MGIGDRGCDFQQENPVSSVNLLPGNARNGIESSCRCPSMDYGDRPSNEVAR